MSLNYLNYWKKWVGTLGFVHVVILPQFVPAAYQYHVHRKQQPLLDITLSPPSSFLLSNAGILIFTCSLAPNEAKLGGTIRNRIKSDDDTMLAITIVLVPPCRHKSDRRSRNLHSFSR